MNYDILGLYRENAFIKYNAAAFSKSGREEDKENLLVQLVIRLKLDECGALTPMTDTGGILLIEPFTDDEGRKWIPLYTDLDEVFEGAPTAYMVEIPLRNLVEDAFDHDEYEGMLVNPYTDRVFLGKCELDYVLDTVMRIEHGK